MFTTPGLSSFTRGASDGIAATLRSTAATGAVAGCAGIEAPTA